MMRRLGYGSLFLAVGLLMPVLVWVALFAALRKPRLQGVRRLVPAWNALDSSPVVCRFDSDCPPGYVCVNGRCIPER